MIPRILVSARAAFAHMSRRFFLVFAGVIMLGLAACALIFGVYGGVPSLGGQKDALDVRGPSQGVSAGERFSIVWNDVDASYGYVLRYECGSGATLDVRQTGDTYTPVACGVLFSDTNARAEAIVVPHLSGEAGDVRVTVEALDLSTGATVMSGEAVIVVSGANVVAIGDAIEPVSPAATSSSAVTEPVRPNTTESTFSLYRFLVAVGEFLNDRYPTTSPLAQKEQVAVAVVPSGPDTRSPALSAEAPVLKENEADLAEALRTASEKIAKKKVQEAIVAEQPQPVQIAPTAAPVVTPAPPAAPTAKPIPATPPVIHGVDLMVRIRSVSPTSASFIIVNNGDTATISGWRFGAATSLRSPYGSILSPSQPALAPGQGYVYTLSFSGVSSGATPTFSVTADPYKITNDVDLSNNTAAW